MATRSLFALRTALAEQEKSTPFSVRKTLPVVLVTEPPAAQRVPLVVAGGIAAACRVLTVLLARVVLVVALDRLAAWPGARTALAAGGRAALATDGSTDPGGAAGSADGAPGRAAVILCRPPSSPIGTARAIRCGVQ